MTIQLAKIDAFLQSLFTKMVVGVASNHVISVLMNREDHNNDNALQLKG